MKTRPKNSSTSKSPSPAALDSRCQFSTSDGRRCRMPRWERHPVYCRNHAQREEPPSAQANAAEELLPLSGEFKTSHDVNHALGKLWTLFIEGRIPRRDAFTLAYIGQLLLQTLPSVRREIQESRGSSAWAETLQAALIGAPGGLDPGELLRQSLASGLAEFREEDEEGTPAE